MDKQPGKEIEDPVAGEEREAGKARSGTQDDNSTLGVGADLLSMMQVVNIPGLSQAAHLANAIIAIVEVITLALCCLHDQVTKSRCCCCTESPKQQGWLQKARKEFR
jgi:hypothetical protein